MADILLMKTTGETAPHGGEKQARSRQADQGQVRDEDLEPFHRRGRPALLRHLGIDLGKVLVDYAEWEFCHFIEGEAILTNEEGKSWTLKAGDGFIIPSGFKGTWETVKKVRKHYVILLPRP